MLQDIRYAVRTLRQNPATTILAVIALALGIGANAAIFSVVNAVILQPLPYKDAGRLVFIRSNIDGTLNHPGLAPGEINDIRAQAKLIESIGWVVAPTVGLTGDDQMEHVPAATISEDFLRTLNVQPAIGRALSAKDDIGKEHFEGLLISYELWERRYHLTPTVIGRAIEVNNFKASVVGVLPKGFRLYLGTDTSVPPQIDVWFPADDDSSSRAYHYYQTIARLRQGVSLEQAQAEIDSLSAGMVERNPQAYRASDFRLRLIPLQQDVVKPVRTTMLTLMGAVGFVLLIACANIANLLLARASGRKREIALRSALGASRIQVIRQLLTESVTLALCGGVAGILLGQQGIDLLFYLRPADLPRQDDIKLDLTVTAFAFALTFLCGVLSGLAPAMQAAKVDVISALKESGRLSTSGVRSNRIRAALVTVQVASSVVLLIGAGLMIRSFANLQRFDLGFDPSHVLTFKLEANPWDFRSDEEKWRFYKRAQETFRAQPGVESVSGTLNVPLDPSQWTDNYGMPEAPDIVQTAVFSPVLPGYFETMRIPLLAGRDFTIKDNDDGAAIVIVDDELARNTWPGADPIGKRLSIRVESRVDRQVAEVVGVVRHVQAAGLHADFYPQIYVPYRNDAMKLTMTVRAYRNPRALASPLRRLAEGLGGKRPVWDIRLMDDYVADVTAPTRFALILLGAMSTLAFVLSAIGIYGVVSYSVSERSLEFAIRRALGAQASDILKITFRWGLRPAIVGVGVGLAAAIALTRFLSSLLFGVRASDLATYATTGLSLLVVAVLACYLPIRSQTLRKRLPQL